MKIDFRVDFGYQYLYSRRHYHPTYLWDGSISCTDGLISEAYQLEYPVIWFGPGHSAKETKLLAPEWKIHTKRGLAGVRFIADVSDESVFTLSTISGVFKFKASDIQEKGRIEFPVGPKYLGCFVTVTLTNYLWYRAKYTDGKVIFESNELGLPVHDWSRMKLAWLKPGATVEWEACIPESSADYYETLFHIIAMGAPEYSDEKESQIESDIPLEILCDGEIICNFVHYFRKHDAVLEILDDVWQRIQINPGKHRFALKNKHDMHCLAINRIIMQQSERNHGQLSVPEWALINEKIIGKIFAVKEDILTIISSEKEYKVDCKKGWNEFEFSVAKAGNTEFFCGNETAVIEIIDSVEEDYPIKVGYDMTQIPHDDSGELDWILDYTQRTRLGNYVVFRDFSHKNNGELMYKWGNYCRTHGIYAAAATDFMDGKLIEGAGEMFNDCGLHEFPGKVYACDPAEPYLSDDMKQASERYIEFLKKEIDKTHEVSSCVGFGDASGGIRYSFLAGADFVRAETMVAHTMTLLSQARPAAEALGNGRWGVHIAIQHCYQPYRKSHLGQYFLSLVQPWMMGAEAIYEEDSLFGMWSEERQCWDDLLVKGKRDMTRKFFKFAKTHPRHGKSIRNIAFLEGRYAAPFNGFIAGSEQDPHYSVWGLFGNDAPEWGHGQPEKCRQILDVLMPGASTHPLRQRFDKRRFYFSGTPYGDFDCVPVESSADYIKNYKLLLNIGWNTMISEDYEKLKDFVTNGGVLLTGIMQFSTHTKRDFLNDMKNPALWNNGDLTELCGIEIIGEGDKYCGQWNCRELLEEPQLSAIPSDNVDEDGIGTLADVKLCGAEIEAWDAESGMPMLVKYKYGNGYVYTFTLWAYPGHEKFKNFAAAWVKKLAKESLGDVYVEDKHGEVFWTLREYNDKKIIMMINTDWTTEGNEKNVSIIANKKRYDVSVKEQMIVIAEVLDEDINIKKYTLSDDCKSVSKTNE